MPVNGRECHVQPVHVNEKCSESWTAGGAKELRRARQAVYTHVIHAEDARLAPIPRHTIALQAGGLLQRHPTLCDKLGVSVIRQTLTTAKPAMPRAWDPRDEHDHFSGLYSGATPQEYTAAMRRAFAGARHHTIPPRMQDVLYKILVSGHWIGMHKETGHRRFCTACRQCGMQT